jgi:predicted DNA-binding protein
MRTTIEIPDETRAELLALAAHRGGKGFSGIVQEALDHYFEAGEERAAKVAKALDALGTLEPVEADRLEKEIRKLRGSLR